MTNANQRPRRTKSKNTHVTPSGKTIKINRSLSDRRKAGQEAKAQRKAAYLSSLPKERWKRLLYRLHPKRLYQYWFSRDGAIMALKLTGIGFVVVFLLVVGLFAYFRKDLPKIRDLNSANSGGSIAYYDRTGKTLLFQDYDTFKRIPVDKASDISPYLREATVSVEDKDFYHEGAFNVKGITRAAFNNLSGGSTQGGSTITQQLVKLNENWTNDHTISRKVKELILAVELEREYSKDDILTAYLNTAPYSGLDIGAQAAAQDMFGVDAKNLSLAQAAMLASIPKEPGTLSPYASPIYNSAATINNFNKIGLIARQQYILDLMAKQGYITSAQATAAKKVDVVAQVQPRPSDHYAGLRAGYAYAIEAAKDNLRKDFPAGVISAGGLKVTTTIDTTLQDLAVKSMNDNASKLHADGANDASFVSEDNTTGQIVALVGGMDFNTQKLNFASSAPISPGSSIKPYSYAALINDNNNVGAGSLLYDQQGALPGYVCTNKNSPDLTVNPGNCLFDDTRRYTGGVTLRYALGSSLNVPAVKAFTSSDPTDKSTAADGSNWRRASINNSMKTINSFMNNSDGYKCYLTGTDLLSATQDDEKPCDSGAGIGNEAYTTLKDHVNGLASLARMGQSIPSTMIVTVTNSANKVLKQFEQPAPKQVVKADAAYIVNNMAADPGASYLGLYGGSCTSTATTCTGYRFHRYKGWDNAIKTGTNEDRDGLMMSWNTKYTAGVWIGNYDRSGYGGTPEKVTDPIMKSWMEGAIDNLGAVKPTNWTQPTDIKTAAAYRSALPFNGEATPPATDLYPSWYSPSTAKTGSTSQTIDKVSGLIATSCTPDLAKQTSYNGNSSSFNVDIFMGGTTNSNTTPTTSNTAAKATDNVHNCSDAMPAATITAVNGTAAGGSANLTCPLTGCVIMVHVDQGTHALTDSAYPTYPGTLNLLVNGQVAQSAAVSAAGDYQLTYTPPAGSTGAIQVEAQITDSVLDQGSDTKTVTIGDATPKKTSLAPSSGPGNPNPTAKQLVTLSSAPTSGRR